MRKLLGNSLKLPDSQLCSRLSELALDGAGRVKICPDGRPVSQCRRLLSAPVSTEGDEAGLGCCLFQNGNSASSSSAGGKGSNDNNMSCAITGSSQCFLDRGATTASQQLQAVSGAGIAPSSPVITNTSVSRTLQSSSVICRRNLAHCACRHMTTMTESQLMIDTPVADMLFETKASATFTSYAASAAQEEEDQQDSDDDVGPTEGVPSESKENGAPYLAKGERVYGEAVMANGAATEVNGTVRSTVGTEGDNLTGTAEVSNEAFGGTTEVGSCESSFRCWNCGQRRVDSTSRLSVNHFDLFSLKQEFWQKRLHPDLFATKSATEKAHSAQQSAHAVNAYYTLKRPLSRAMYMVQLEAPEVGNDIEDGTVQDRSLLMEVMDFRERIEHANGDSGMLKRLADENSEKAVNNMEAVATVLDAKH
ncbi:hypothetical protein CBR_g31284 [Chara braunii]|uniref:Co-chaperone HscB C-terminal oligomerisation domain-containing protein n=1 Tax=Chara braunii TaxID=69332 RepID=A0A388LEJ3_CHABU|nr:hypothetical protein CBR_g31284 [Chara braunii]|eukprot:GBG80729.1 hypothetical protein CBR_g31284 [Chara braunii]